MRSKHLLALVAAALVGLLAGYLFWGGRTPVHELGQPAAAPESTPPQSGKNVEVAPARPLPPSPARRATQGSPRSPIAPPSADSAAAAPGSLTVVGPAATGGKSDTQETATSEPVSWPLAPGTG